MPSAKSALRPASLLCASFCSSMSCRVLALSSPDLFEKVLALERYKFADLLTFALASQDCDPEGSGCKRYSVGRSCNRSGQCSMRSRLTCRNRLSCPRSLPRSLPRSCQMGHRMALKLCCSPALREVTRTHGCMQHTEDLHTALASLAHRWERKLTGRKGSIENLGSIGTL